MELSRLKLIVEAGKGCPRTCCFDNSDLGGDKCFAQSAKWNPVISWSQTGRPKEVEFEPRTARYWRLYIDSTHGGDVCIGQVKLYGTQATFVDLLTANKASHTDEHIQYEAEKRLGSNSVVASLHQAILRQSVEKPEESESDAESDIFESPVEFPEYSGVLFIATTGLVHVWKQYLFVLENGFLSKKRSSDKHPNSDADSVMLRGAQVTHSL